MDLALKWSALPGLVAGFRVDLRLSYQSDTDARLDKARMAAFPWLWRLRQGHSRIKRCKTIGVVATGEPHPVTQLIHLSFLHRCRYDFQSIFQDLSNVSVVVVVIDIVTVYIQKINVSCCWIVDLALHGALSVIGKAHESMFIRGRPTGQLKAQPNKLGSA